MKLSFKRSKEERSTVARKPGGQSLKRLALTSFSAVALLLILVWGGLFYLYQDAERESSLAQLKNGVDGLATRLAETESVYRRFLQALATDPLVIAALQGGDNDAIQRQQQRLTQLVPGAINVRLLRSGHQALNKSSRPHLSYASLQLLRTAEKSAQVTLAEVHQFSSEHQHIAMAVRVTAPSSSVPIGVIHAAFSTTALQMSIDAIADYGGRVELRQVVSGVAPLVLAEHGSSRIKRGEPNGHTLVGSSIWEVVYWVGSNRVDNTNIYLIFGLSLFITLLLIGLLLHLHTRRLLAILKCDLVTIISIVERMVLGKLPGTFKPALQEMEATLELIAHHAREFRAGSIGETAKKAVASGAGEAIHVDENPESKLPKALQPEPEVPAPVTAGEIPAGIFRAYDVRGIVGEVLTAEVVYEIGRAVGSEAYEKGQQTVIIARDGRNSSPEMADALCRGLQASGRDVVDLGLVPTPVLYFATHHLGSNSGVIVTGSHNPANYNGLKFVIDGNVLSSDAIQAVRTRIENGDLLQGDGEVTKQDLVPDYITRIVDDVRLARSLNVVIDCGNGVAGKVAPELFRALGCDVTEMFCEVDGDFPNHHPDPCDPKNLVALQEKVKATQADIGLAFDGDGDRLGVVDSEANIIWPDQILMYLAADVLARHPGVDIIYDVKSTRHLASEILAHGGRPVMWKTGHSMLKSKMKETGALLAGEYSGHIIFSERWYGFDDALYAGARLLEVLAIDPRASAEVFAELPQSVTTPEYSMPLAEGENVQVMAELAKHVDFPNARVIDIDGLRIEFEQGWGLVRASNTTPSLVFRFEGDDEETLEKLKALFRNLLSKVKTSGQIPF
ncbi:MAG: phosphomannomutase/phosphoglucomutase [Candidatus Polarisedimenticolaceae bacterium]|nr:phosphomannomutase/phosphoglucomutase [Candidatus Polarisedimenticolaceae bacterium]